MTKVCTFAVSTISVYWIKPLSIKVCTFAVSTISVYWIKPLSIKVCTFAVSTISVYWIKPLSIKVCTFAVSTISVYWIKPLSIKVCTFAVSTISVYWIKPLSIKVCTFAVSTISVYWIKPLLIKVCTLAVSTISERLTFLSLINPCTLLVSTTEPMEITSSSRMPSTSSNFLKPSKSKFASLVSKSEINCSNLTGSFLIKLIKAVLLASEIRLRMSSSCDTLGSLEVRYPLWINTSASMQSSIPFVFFSRVSSFAAFSASDITSFSKPETLSM